MCDRFEDVGPCCACSGHMQCVLCGALCLHCRPPDDADLQCIAIGIYSVPMAHWIVARTKSRRERWAAENVQRLGFDFYLPQYEIKVRPRRKLSYIKSEVLFPSYLFVFITGHWRVLLSTFGIASIVLRGDQPAIMPVAEIERLQNRTVNGLVQLPNAYKVNQSVVVRSGPFAKHVGLYVGQTSSGRQAVLMDLLGGKVKVLFDLNMLEAA